nr:cache domain-containing protein [Bacillus sp. M6-12]
MLRHPRNLGIKMIQITSEKVKSGEISMEDAQDSVKEQLLGVKSAEGKRKIQKILTLAKTVAYMWLTVKATF